LFTDKTELNLNSSF